MIDPETISWTIRLRATPAWKTAIWSDPATANGDEVRSIGDVLDGPTLAFNLGASGFPTFRTNESGHPAIRFTAADASNLLANPLPLGDLTWFAILRPLVLAGTAWSNRDPLAQQLRIGERVEYSIAPSHPGVRASGQVGTTGRHLIEGQYLASPGESDLWIDGRRVGRLVGVTALTPSPNGLIVGGRGSPVADAWSGDLFELALVSRAMGEPERAGLRAYWMDHYGIVAGGATSGQRARRHIDAGDAG